MGGLSRGQIGARLAGVRTCQSHHMTASGFSALSFCAIFRTSAAVELLIWVRIVGVRQGVIWARIDAQLGAIVGVGQGVIWVRIDAQLGAIVGVGQGVIWVRIDAQLGAIVGVGQAE